MTKSIMLKSHVGPDGVLNLQVPIGFVNSDLEIVLVVVPMVRGRKTPEEFGWPSGFFERTYGSLPDLPEIDRKAEFEIREELA